MTLDQHAALTAAVALFDATPQAIRAKPFCRHGNADRRAVSARGVTGYGTTWPEAAIHWREGAEAILKGETDVRGA